MQVCRFLWPSAGFKGPPKKYRGSVSGIGAHARSCCAQTSGRREREKREGEEAERSFVDREERAVQEIELVGELVRERERERV